MLFPSVLLFNKWWPTRMAFFSRKVGCTAYVLHRYAFLSRHIVSGRDTTILPQLNEASSQPNEGFCKNQRTRSGHAKEQVKPSEGSAKFPDKSLRFPSKFKAFFKRTSRLPSIRRLSLFEPVESGTSPQWSTTPWGKWACRPHCSQKQTNVAHSNESAKNHRPLS